MDKKQSHTDNLKFLQHETADSLSFNDKIAKAYLEDNNVDIQKLIDKGLSKIQSTLKKKELEKSKGLFFKRVVLAAEIVNNLHGERTFGHVKFQKLVYLCEKTVNMELSRRYSKQVAGPMDTKFMHSIDRELKKQKWFDVSIITSNGFNRYSYSPGENVRSYKLYFNRYYGKHKDEISWILKTFKTAKTDQVELVATLYACLEELRDKNIKITPEKLIEHVYEWSEEKKKYKERRILSAYSWMIENNLYPKSYN